MDKAQIEEIRVVFNSYDDDNDGLIQPEIIERVIRALGYNPTPAEMEDILLDVKNQAISFNTFAYIIHCHSRYVHPEKDLIQSFSMFDKDRSGFLPVTTVRNILKNINNSFTDEQIDEYLEKLSLEGLVDYSKLAHLLLHN